MVNYNIIVNWFVDEESYNIAIIVKYDKFNNNFIVTMKSLNGENFDFADRSGIYETVHEIRSVISNYILCISSIYPESTIIKSWYSRSDEKYHIIEKYEFFERLSDEEFNKLCKAKKKIFYYRGGKDVIDNVRHEILIK